MLYISNFMLDLNNKIMKNSIVMIVLVILVIISSILWFVSAKEMVDLIDLLSAGIVLILVVFALYVAIQRIRSIKKGEPAEDELSKSIMLRASSVSFYISIYLWLAVMYFSDHINLESHSMIGMGILGMAITFFLSWLVIKLKGFVND